MLNRRQVLTTSATLAVSALPGSSLLAGVINTPGGRVRLSSGRCLAWRQFGVGDGIPVFYFHGTPGSKLEAGLIHQEACRVGVRLIAIDRPGMGSSTYECGRRILDWPGDFIQLVDAMGYTDTEIGVISLSGGAPYASACAYKVPDRLRHVVIVSGHAPLYAPGTCPGNQDKMIRLTVRRPRLAKMIINMVTRRLDRRPEKVVKNMSKSWSAADRRLIFCNPLYHQMLIENLDHASCQGTQGIITDVRLLGCRWGFDVGSIRGVPVTIWQGGCDPIVTPSMARYFHRKIAGSELFMYPPGGHITTIKHNATAILQTAAGLG